MDRRLVAGLIPEIASTFEDRLVTGHHIYTDFIHYSALVRAMVEEARKICASRDESLVCFTGLCIPPFQWFNFSMSPVNATNIADIERMEVDGLWTKYLDFWEEMASIIELTRCLFVAPEVVPEQAVFFRHLPAKDAVTYQLGDKIKLICRDRESPKPLESRDIRRLLSAEQLANKYKCYAHSKRAFLIVEEGDLRSVGAEFSPPVPILEAINRFHMVRMQTWSPENLKEMAPRFPQDFFVVGVGHDIKYAQWKFALTADLSPGELGRIKVRLCLLGNASPSRTRQANGELKDDFTFAEVMSFLKREIIENMISVDAFKATP